MPHLLNSMAAGIPNFCNHMLMMVTSIVLNNMLATYGAMSVYGSDIPLAVSGVAQKTSIVATKVVNLFILLSVFYFTIQLSFSPLLLSSLEKAKA